MTFEEAEKKYAQLLQQWHGGQLTPEQFTEAVNLLRVRAEDGSWWQIQGKDGAWLRWNGTVWEVTPRPVAMPPPPPVDYPTQYDASPGAGAAAAGYAAETEYDSQPSEGQYAHTEYDAQPGEAQYEEPKQSRGCLRACLVILVVFVCLAAVGAAGGYFAIRSGNLNFSAMQLSTQLTGVADVSVINTDGETLSIRLLKLDGADGDSSIGRDDLQPLDVGGYGGLNPGRYQMEFRTADGAPADMDCIFRASRGDSLQFVVVPEGIAIFKEGFQTENPADLDVSQSFLCKQ